jgi:hypothetical protein
MEPMLRNLRELFGFAIMATDGEIGRVHDFYFDDQAWAVRYLVSETGHWLTGRLVLISPQALRAPDWRKHAFPVSLTKQQVEDSPSIYSDLPVSRQHEIELHRHYGWTPYWGGGIFPGDMLAFYPALMQTIRRPEKEPVPYDPATSGGDPHLRSAREVIGYHVRAIDGEIGHVEDFIVEDGGWALRYLVVDTHNWLPGKRVLLSPRWIDEVSWGEARAKVGLRRSAVKEAPEYHHGMEIDWEYEEALRRHYHSAGSRPGKRSRAGAQR